MKIEPLATVLVLTAFGLLFYTYAGYPAFLWLLGRLVPIRAAAPRGPLRWPDVSIILSAYNEERVIEARLRNLLALAYPPDRLEILIGSDGSTDRTCDIVRDRQSDRVRLVAFAERRGKASVLNDLVRLARGEVIVLTDANTFFHPDAVRELVRALWRHPTACAVVGQVEIRSPSATGNLDGVYWRYETWIKTLESRFGCVLGANGPIYAVRRDRYVPISSGTIVDDFQIPLRMRLHGGGQVFFVPEAQAWEESPARVRDEFRRRVRIGAGDLQAIFWTWPLLLPWKGMVAVAYVSHKLLRWLGPWLLLLGWGANLLLLDVPVFRFLFLAQAACYGLALLAPLVRMLGLVAAALRYFLVLNAALLLGHVRLACGAARPFWGTTPRQAADADGSGAQQHGAAAGTSTN